MIELRKPKGRGGIGGHGEQRSSKRTAFKCRKPLRKVSRKQRKRNLALKEKFKVIATEHVRLYGTPGCEEGRSMWAKGIPANCAGQLLVDHVGTRNQVNSDRYENLQLLCYFHNTRKSSVRKDYRSIEMLEVMRKLDKV